MDYTAIGASIITGLASIGAVAVFLKNFMPKFTKWVALAKDAVETISDISNALLPDSNGKVELTQEEITKITMDAAKFKADLAVLLAK